MHSRWMSSMVLAVLMAGVVHAATPLEVGGPLEGPVLAPFPVQHGEAPGQPGCVPALIARSAADTNAPEGEWTPAGSVAAVPALSRLDRELARLLDANMCPSGPCTTRTAS